MHCNSTLKAWFSFLLISPGGNAYILAVTDIWSYSLSELVQIGGSGFKNTPIHGRKSRGGRRGHVPPPSEGCPPQKKYFKKITLSIVKNICMYTYNI